MRKFLSILALSCVLTMTLQPLFFAAFAQENQNDDESNTTETTTTTTTTTTNGIPVSNNGLPPNLPRLNMEGIKDPVKLTESFMLTYIIRPIFFLSGGVAIIMIMYSAFQIITARGEEDGLSGAKTTLIWSFVGLGLVMLAYTIVSNLAAIILKVT